ncbi:polyprenyl synthetase family protein (plasmid) [Verrucomicrobiaceae bacterium 227]
MQAQYESAAALLEESIPDVDLMTQFRELISPDPDAEPRLAKAILHVVAHPGSFIRARMAWNVGYATGLDEESCGRAAIAVEYFHTASLILDDLSCMDDADMRRGGRCVHALYGEAVAMLTALAFINRAYSLIWAETAKLSGEAALAVTTFVASCLGTNGVLSGQSRDLAFGPEDNSPEKILKIAEGKTVSLLRLSLCLPAMLAEETEKTVSLLGKLSLARGLGYQIADDFKDVFHGEDASGKTSNRDRALHRPNLVICEGVPAAAQRLQTLVKEGDFIERTLLSQNRLWTFLSDLRITVGPELINKNGVPLSGNL